MEETQLSKWGIYSLLFGMLLYPVFILLGITDIVTMFCISLIPGFFAGALNAILTELQEINNKL